MKKIKQTAEQKIKKITSKVKIGNQSLDTIIGNTLNSKPVKVTSTTGNQ